MADGYISDESDFYGSAMVRAAWERKARRQLEPDRINQYTRLINVQRARKGDITGNQSKPTHSSHQPQIATIDEDTPMATAPGQEEEAYDFDVRDPSSWNPKMESIQEFLQRAPVSDPATADLGPWLWVHNPKASRTRDAPTRISELMEVGTGLLNGYRQRKAQLEAENAGKSEATITRKLTPFRKQLQEDLLHAAVDANVTCGKWLLFPKLDNMARTWQQVAEATAAGRLGPTSKVGTPEDNGKDVGLICVYTHDFADTADVRRVLVELVDLGLAPSPIYYKCDAYTYLNIISGNEYKLKASLYASRDMLKGSGSKMSEQEEPSTAKDDFFSNLSL